MIFKMKRIKSITLFFLLLSLTYSCHEEAAKPLNNDDTVPPVVSQLEVKNLSGEVEISYQVPTGTSLLYVEAEVDMGSGRIVKTKSSYYNSSISIEGFGEAKAYEVKLYSVGRNLKRSEPISVTVNPLNPPIKNIFNTLEIVEDFGGLSISFENESEAEVSVVVERLDENGDWTAIETFYTKQKDGVLAVRGLEATLQNFRIYVNDRWGNKSDVLATELTPLFEVELDRTQFSELHLLNDPSPFGANHVSFLWNDNLSGSRSGSGGWYRTANGTPMPTQITIDMGVTAKLSRFKFWQRGTISETRLLYTAGSPRYFEIWGSNNPTQDGSYDSWTKLMDGELIKPSGQPVPNNSPEDLEVAAGGHEYIIPLDAPPVRYIRIKVLRTFGVTEYFWMSEIKFFGKPNN